MPKIELLEDWDGIGQAGAILDKPDAWILHHARKAGIKFEVQSQKPKITGDEIIDRITGNSITELNFGDNWKEKAFMQLSDGDKDSVRKGFKALRLRKNGTILVDCANKAMEEIHIMSIESNQLKISKDSAIARAASEVGVLKEFKRVLHLGVDGEDCIISCEDKEQAHSLVDRLSIGYSEVEVLKAKIEELTRLLGKGK